MHTIQTPYSILLGPTWNNTTLSLFPFIKLYHHWPAFSSAGTGGGEPSHTWLTVLSISDSNSIFNLGLNDSVFKALPNILFKEVISRCLAGLVVKHETLNLRVVTSSPILGVELT